MRDPDKVMEEGYRRQQIIERAVEAADRIICNGADGDKELLNLFTAQLAVKFAEKCQMAASAEVLRKDLGL